MSARLAALCLLALAACAEEDRCPSPIVSIRDPGTLVCSPHKLPTDACPLLTIPPWSSCGDPCERIRDAATCAATAQCRIGWLDCLTFPDECDHPDGFIGCYGVATAEVSTGACADVVGAEACASRDDCAGFYIKGPTCPGGDPLAYQPNGESCRFMYARCVDELPAPQPI